ncbi:hypothetical protein LCGC14_1896410 [marine sediment metagenome]|uniref:Uncharacterized protein n=1 Tax=marine sediment metagenome TaxID=412755 RepID=A0A0F9FY80_9ZZZZ
MLPGQPCQNGVNTVYYYMDSTPGTVKKTLLVPREDYERFRLTHPQHGAFVWFVRTALRRYNLIHNTDPKELIDLAVGEITLTED